MSKTDSPDEILRNAIAITTAALSETPEVEVTFSADGAWQSDKRINLPAPSRKVTLEEIQRIRGEGDSMSLRMAHHDESLHAKQRPETDEARRIFEAAERARIDAIGANAMDGVAENLDAALNYRCERAGYLGMEDRQSIPFEDALEMVLRERLTNRQLPRAADHVAAFWRDEISDRAAGGLDDIEALIHDQKAFAEQVRKLINNLQIGDDVPAEDEQDETASEDDSVETPDADTDVEDDQSGDDPDNSSTEEVEAEDSDAAQDRDMEMPVEADMDITAEEEGAESEEGPKPLRPNFREGDSDPNFNYEPYTTAFDEIATADALCDPDELTRLRSYLDTQLQGLQGAVSRLANRLQRRLMAQQNRSWQFDLEEGVLDTARLTRVVVDPTTPLSFKQEDESSFRDTVVTLLLDNSGSMRGRPIMVAALCADVLARTLERCGVKVEILGFTTKAWKGGLSREDWIKNGKPPTPGRLNDLRHIIYKSADAPWRRARRNLGLMMREGLLKENIDGEALMWAHERLIGRPEQRRILMVISDGAPVDDSTLSVNAGNCLERHLRQVIEFIETRSSVELLAIGIGHDVTRYYRRAVTIVDAEQLGGAMTDKLAELFEEETPQSLRKQMGDTTSRSGKPGSGARKRTSSDIGRTSYKEVRSGTKG